MAGPHPEQTPPAVVARPRLAERLAAGLRRGRLLLVVAPAGYGKTTLLRAWLAGRDAAGPYLWHTLDEADNDPAHLLAGIRAGLQAARPALTLPALDAASPLAYALDLLFRQAAPAVPQDWLLLLDDYHLITNPAVHQALDTLLGQPTWPARLVLAGRGLPPLAAVARLRVEGRLTELDETDLRFTPEETRPTPAAIPALSTPRAATITSPRTRTPWTGGSRRACRTTSTGTTGPRARRPTLAPTSGRGGCTYRWGTGRRSRGQGAGSKKQEAGRRMQEAGSKKQEAGCRYLSCILPPASYKKRVLLATTYSPTPLPVQYHRR